MTSNNDERSCDRFADLRVSTLNDVERASLIKLAMKILAARHHRGRAIRSPADTENYLKLRLAEEAAERFGCVFLDNRHRVLAIKDLFHGTIDGTSVYPRVVVQKALEINAAAVILFHNHPSGVAEPSQADERITRRLKHALELIDVRVLDHIIVTCGNCTSLAARGLL
jgi:DNA repair protein RadC